MTTKLDPNKIIHILNQSTRHLNQQTLTGLQQARTLALQKQARKAHAFQLAGNNWTGFVLPHTKQKWSIAALLLIAIFASADAWWQHTQQHHIELDEQILTDELPIEIFID